VVCCRPCICPVFDEPRVHGVSNLRVVDPSVMPTISSGNTDAPMITVAEKAAEPLTERRAVTADD